MLLLYWPFMYGHLLLYSIGNVINITNSYLWVHLYFYRTLNISLQNTKDTILRVRPALQLQVSPQQEAQTDKAGSQLFAYSAHSY